MRNGISRAGSASKPEPFRSYPRVVVMSEKDARCSAMHPNVRIIPNGVDVKRFQIAPEAPGCNILFVGSFRHFPNVLLIDGSSSRCGRCEGKFLKPDS